MGLFDDITSVVSAPFTAGGDMLGGAMGGATNGIMKPIKDNYSVSNPYSQADLAQALQHSNGIYGNQTALAQALQGQAMNGTGPVQQIVNQNMEQAAQQQATNNASNRALNPGLAARLSGNQVMQARAAAAGMGAQAQMASQGALGNLYGSMGQQSLEQQNLMNNANMGAEKINSGVSETNTATAGKVAGGMLQGAGSAAAMVAAAHGAMVPGKAKVNGDSPKNDTVKAKLSPGEIVLPRSVTESEDAGNKAKEFVESLKKQKESKEGKSGGYSKVLEAHRKLGEALKGLKAS